LLNNDVARPIHETTVFHIKYALSCQIADSVRKVRCIWTLDAFPLFQPISRCHQISLE